MSTTLEEVEEYAVFRLFDDKPGCVDYCGSVYAECLSSAEARLRD